MKKRNLGTVALVPVVSFALVLAACGSDDKAADTTTTSTIADSSSTSSTSTTAAPSTKPETTGITTPPSIPASNAEEYATELIEAWSKGDRATADTLAVPAAVEKLFGYEAGGEEGQPAPTWALQTCEGAAGSSYCTFSAGGDPKVIVRVGNEAASQGQPQAVTEVQVES